MLTKDVVSLVAFSGSAIVHRERAKQLLRDMGNESRLPRTGRTLAICFPGVPWYLAITKIDGTKRPAYEFRAVNPKT